ncbi:hypothetical protein ACFLQR_00845, partial [Verrucomicrobiota bacterium]
KNILRIGSYLIASLLIVAAVTTSYYVGDKRGDIDGQIRRIPLEFDMFLPIHDFIDHCSETGDDSTDIDRLKGNLEILLLSNLMLLEIRRERFEQIFRSRLDQMPETNRRFEENVERARKIVKDAKFVSLDSVIRDTKTNESYRGSGAP